MGKFRMACLRKISQYYLPVLIVIILGLLTGLTEGLSHSKLRLKRNNQFEHTNIVNVFLSQLENNQKPKDIVFILDRSESVGNKRFYLEEKNLVDKLIRQYFVIKPGDFNVAVVTFGNDVTTVIDYVSRGTTSPLKCDFVEKSHILDQIQYMEPPPGTSEEELEKGLDIKGAYRAAINILQNTKSPGNQQIVVVMTTANFKDSDAPVVELGELYLVPVFGVALGEFSQHKMAQATHYYSNFTYWKQRTETTDYHAAYLKHPEYHVYTGEGSTCGVLGNTYCDVITGYSTCLCNKGSTRGQDGQCTECPQGYFKETQGNGPCQACPQEAAVSMSPIGGTAYHTSCFCFNSYYSQWMQCPDYCRTDPFDPLSAQYCTAARRCVRSASIAHANGALYSCDCLEGVTGSFCNDDIKECSIYRCVNNAKCVERYNQVACLCPWGFSGEVCEIRTDQCQNRNACPPRSTCHQREPYNYECICDKGYNNPDCIHEDCLFKDCGVNGTVKDTKSSALEEKESGAFSGATKWVVMILPPCAAALVVIVISVGALVHLRRKSQHSRNDVSKAASNITDTTSVISRNPSLITFDSKCYQDEGTPAVPNLSANFYDFDDTVYGNEPLQKGMDEWYAYVLALVHNNNLTRLMIVRLDGEKWVLSPGCRLSLTETKTLFNLISNRVYSKAVTIQGREFGIVSNEDLVIVAHSTGGEKSDHEIACATKTRQFVITATAMFAGDNGACRRDIMQIRDHIKLQGL